jgi:ABC-type nitrate/sulfonate/bicarbonate transport system substrate-binding protein
MLRFTTLVVAATLAGLSASAAQTLIRVGWGVPAEDTKYLLRHKPELFPNHGKTYRVEWFQFQSSAVQTQSMVANAVDCSAQGVLALAQAHINTGLQGYIVAQHVYEKPGGFSVYWAVKDDSPVRTVGDLRGKTVGISAFGAGIYGPFAMHLRRHGLDPEKDVRLVETGFGTSEDAIRAGRIEAGVLNQPFAARAEAKGGIRKVFAISDEIKNMVHIMEVCRKDFVDANEAAVRDYVRDLTTAMGMVMSDRDQALAVASQTMRVSKDVLATFMLTDRDFGRTEGAAPDFTAIQTLLDLYTTSAMIPKKVDATTFKHPSIVAPLR